MTTETVREQTAAATSGPPAPPFDISLMGMLAREAARDHQATEALFLTYNADLGFFEARLLGLCQATGARVTVLADSSVWAPDARAVRQVGRGYHVGLAATRGAFHPKMLVLAGPKRVMVGIGSGNLTMGGWQYNSELLTVFTGDHTGVPQPIAHTASMLASLPTSLRLDPWTREAVRRTVAQLDYLLNDAPRIETAHTVAASWQGPLIDRLPQGPVAELLLHAPFHDPHSRAVGRLLDRLTPKHVHIALQPGWTEVDPLALQTVLERYTEHHDATVEVVKDLERSPDQRARYRHGKLIEWVTTEGQRFALTGSPNLSVAALLHSTAEGGNHEIAVTGPLTRPLFPDGAPVNLIDIPPRPDANEDESAEPTRHRITILSAARTGALKSRSKAEETAEEGITIHLSRQAPAGLTVQVSPRESSPNTWQDAGAVPAGAQQHHLAVSLPGGSRIRLRGVDSTGKAWFSPTTFISDPDRVLRRYTGNGGTERTHRTTPLDLFGDDTAFLTAVLDDLTRFASETRTASGPHASVTHDDPRQTSDGDESHQGVHRIDPWLWIQDDTIQRLGPALGGFALGLPPLTAGDDPTLAWADRLTDESDLGLEVDTAEATADPPPGEEAAHDRDVTTAADVDDTTAKPSSPDTEPPLDQRADPTNLRTARRRWCARATALAPNLTLGSRLFVLRTVLRVWSAGNWDAGDAEPLELLHQLMGSLDQAQMPREAEARVGSMVAVALTLARAGVNLRNHNQAHLRYRRLVEDFSHLLLAAEPDLVEAYTTGLATIDGVTLSADSVAATCADLTTEDPLADVEETLTQDGYDVMRPFPHLLHVTGRFSNPEPIALGAIGQSEHNSRIGVWATNHAGDWALVVWRKPDLVTITERNGSRRWRHQILSGHLGPAAIAYQLRTGTLTAQYDQVTKPKHRPTQQARAVLAAVGITEPTPPSG